MKAGLRHVIVITGTPGTGKTAVAAGVADRIGAKWFSLGDLAVKHGYILGKDRDRGTLVADEDGLRVFLERFICEVGGRIIIEGHYSHIAPEKYLDCCIVLRTAPEELERRLLSKGYSEGKVLENVQAEILGVCAYNALMAYGRARIFELDTSHRDVDSVVDEAVEIVECRPKSYSLGKINWLSSLSREGFKRYFQD